jgi:hypothetical protein
MALKIAYLINQYPKVSHSFIRREILALEATGISVLRYAVRSCADELVDEADRQELKKTRFLLEGGAIALAKALLSEFLRHPTHPLCLSRRSLRLTQLAHRRRSHPSPRPLWNESGNRRHALPHPRRTALQLHRPRS